MSLLRKPVKDDELRRTFALANAFKEGDLAVHGTADDHLRADARRVLLSTTLSDIRNVALIDDGVTAALERSRDRRFDRELDALTVAQLKVGLLGTSGPSWAKQRANAFPSEVIAAVVKVMSNEELSSVARASFNPLEGGGVAIGSPEHLGSRIQPNSPGDDEHEILFSILEGLAYGCGDVIIGLNPAADDLDRIVHLEQLLERVVRRLNLPTRYCVLSDIVKQHNARRHTRVDVGFQSLAGTSKGLAGMVGLDVDGLIELARGFDGLYFETGQGSEVTNGAAEGVDMVTLEARTYGVARHIRHETSCRWMIVNDVAGFVGPEVFRNAEQLERACLEDAVMAKLHGLTMGLDVCATFHMGIAPRELHSVTERLADHAAPAYLMAVAGNADPMLGYLTTSFREHPRLRRQTRRQMTSAMEERLRALGITEDASDAPNAVPRLYARYVKAAGDRRTTGTLEEEGRDHVIGLRERGFDLGMLDGAQSDARLDAIYRHARRALYATLDDGVIRDACLRSVRVRTTAGNRDDYLAHPALGERLRAEDARVVATIYPLRKPQAQFVISDGLNADAVNEHLRTLLPMVRRHLTDSACDLGEIDFVVENGRVRVGYEIGGLTGADVIVHLVGERPGTGLNTLSAYITYGHDHTGAWRWNRDLDHSATTAICGIHAKGKPPRLAAAEIAGTVGRVIEQRRSGVALTAN